MKWGFNNDTLAHNTGPVFYQIGPPVNPASAAAGAGISWGTLGIGAAFSIGSALLERRSQKRKMRRARRERAKMKEQAEQRSAEIGGAFESLIETRRLQMQADDPALRAARRTLVRQKQRSQQIRARSRQAGVSPEAIVELTQGANFEEYIGEKMQRLQEVQMGTAAIEQLTQAKTQAQSDIFKTGLGAQTQLVAQETQMMADMKDPWASFFGAMGTGFAEEALSSGEAKTGKATAGSKSKNLLDEISALFSQRSDGATPGGSSPSPPVNPEGG